MRFRESRLLLGILALSLCAIRIAAQPIYHEIDEPTGTGMAVKAGISTPVSSPLSPIGTIGGPDYDTNRTNTGGYVFIPPDPIGAAGPDHVVCVVNVTIQWHTKAGVLQHNQSLKNFFAPLAPLTFTFDPKVIYDQHAGRFVVVTLEKTYDPDPSDTSRILLAVSDDDDPNGVWYFHQINSKIGVYWADYPGFAVDEEAVYITCNLFSFDAGAPGGQRLWIVDKTAFYAGGATVVTVYDPWGVDAGTTQPAHIFGTAPANVGTWLVQSGWHNGVNAYLYICRVDNPIGATTFNNYQYVNLGTVDLYWFTSPMPDAPQLGSAIDIETNDRRALHAVWRDNSLWVTTTVVPPTGPDADQATAHWIEVDTSNIAALALADQGNVGGEDIATGTHTFFPSIAVNSAGSVGIGFSASAPTIYAGAYYTGRCTETPAGTVQASQTLAAGVDWYVRTHDGDENRWGDYSGMCVDPDDDTTFWVFNEYAISRGTVIDSKDGRWGTRWGEFTVGCSGTVHDITATAGDNGSIDPSDTVEVDDGANQTFTITPDSNHHVADVLVDGASVDAVAEYTFTNVTADHTIHATFAIDTYTVTATAGDNGGIDPSDAVGVDHGANKAFSITPDAGYHVADVLVDGISVGAVTEYTFTNITADHTIHATFAIDAYTITATSGDNGGIDPSGGVGVDHGANKVFSITPDAGYHVADVLVDGASVSAVTEYTFTNITADHTIHATFAIDTYTITATAGDNGSIDPSGAVGVDYGANQAFTVTPDSSYHVADVLVDGLSVDTVAEYTFTNVTADHTIHATFVYVELIIQSFSPVDLVITDPAGRTISKDDTSAIPFSSYTEDDKVTIPDPMFGDYSIVVVPEQGANPTDTYTLDVSYGDETIRLAEDVQVGDIPAEPYVHFHPYRKLVQGWELISLPKQPGNTDITSVLASIEGKYDSVWAYDPNTGWQWYHPGNTQASNLSEMEARRGYWLEVNELCFLKVQGNDPNTAIPLSANWNLPGYCAGTYMDIEDCIASIAVECISVWEYDPVDEWRWYLSAVPDASNLEFMRPGFGYWIESLTACIWDIDEGAPLAPPSIPVARNRYIPSEKPGIPYVIWGNVEVNGVKVTGAARYAPVVLLKVNGEVVSSCQLGTVNQLGDPYALDIPVSVDDSAQVELYVQMYDQEVKADLAPPGRPGQVVRFDLSVQIAPRMSQLHQNYPNPFNPETWIPYQLKEDAHVEVRIYALTGQLVRTLSLGHKPAGFYVDRQRAAYWDGRNEAGEHVASGVYFYSIKAGDLTTTRKMAVTR